MADHEFTFSLKTIRFDEDYKPAENTRATTNFANLARGPRREENLRNAIAMINNRFNALASWDNPTGDRYSLEIDIISADLNIGEVATGELFPLIEILQTHIIDHKTNQRIEGMVGNSFSSYVRDYDFSVLLRGHNEGKSAYSEPENFGVLHGKLFRCFLNSAAYKERFSKSPVICLSVSTSRTYQRTGNVHPVLGIEYQQSDFSPTDDYFGKMGLRARFFMPPGSTAPFAFYFEGDLLADYTPLELISAIATMESFQRIYRPEIYNTNAAAPAIYKPSLQYKDYSLTLVEYDREERSQLAIKQGKLTEEKFIQPYQDVLDAWAANYAL